MHLCAVLNLLGVFTLASAILYVVTDVALTFLYPEIDELFSYVLKFLVICCLFLAVAVTTTIKTFCFDQALQPKTRNIEHIPLREFGSLPKIPVTTNENDGYDNIGCNNPEKKDSEPSSTVLEQTQYENCLFYDHVEMIYQNL